MENKNHPVQFLDTLDCNDRLMCNFFTFVRLRMKSE